MEYNLFSVDAIALSIKRIECLMEEMIFQQILSREPNTEKAVEKFTQALKHVADSLSAHVESLLPTPQTDNPGDISVL